MNTRTVFLTACAFAVVIASGPVHAAWTKDANVALSTCQEPECEREELRAQLGNHNLPRASQLARQITLELVGREHRLPSVRLAATGLRPLRLSPASST